MTTNTTLSINEMFGHMALVTFKPSEYYSPTTMKGKIIYNSYNASLFFMPKGSRNKGYLIDNVNDIKSFELIRKNNKENTLQNESYKTHDESIKLLSERLERQEQEYKEREQKRREMLERQREDEMTAKQQEIDEAKSLCDYEVFENDVLSFYENSGQEYSEGTVKNVLAPMLAKIIYKGITDITIYPKHFFDKRNNPRFCKLLELKTEIKLANTQKKNIEILNEYLVS